MRFLKYFLPVIFITIAILVIYPKFQASIKEIPLLLKEANKILLFFLLGFQALSYFGDGWLSKILLEIAGFNIRLKETIKIAVLSVLGVQVAPLIGGVVITYYLCKKLKIPSATTFFLITFWTVFIWLNYFLFFLLSLFFLPKLLFSLISSKAILLFLTASFPLFVLGYFLCKNQGRNLIAVLHFFIILVNKIGNYFNQKELLNYEKPKGFILDFYKSLNLLLTNKSKIPQALLASFLFYLGNIATLYFSFSVFGFHANLFHLIFGFTISSILAVFTFIPEIPGIMETSLTAVFVTLGFPTHVALFSSLLYRLFSYWLPLLLGVFAYFTFKTRKKEIML